MSWKVLETILSYLARYTHTFVFFILIIFFYQHSHIEQLTTKRKPPTGRKTWNQSTPLKRDHQAQYQHVSFAAAESGRGTLSSEITSSQLSDGAPRMLSHSVAPVAPDVMKASTSSGRRQDLLASG